MALTPHAQFTENADPRVRRCGDIADGHQAVVVVFHAFHHTRNAVHSDPGELIHHPGQERADDRHDEPQVKNTVTSQERRCCTSSVRCCTSARGLRGERLERPFAHLYETGGLRRVYLRGHANILKRVLIHAGGLNLGLLMRHLIGVGTPRSLQGRAVACVRVLWSLVRLPETLWKTIWMRVRPIIPLVDLHLSRRKALADLSVASAFTTDC